MVETRSDAASRREPSPLLVMLLPLGLLVVIALAAWAMFANPVPGSLSAVPSSSAGPTGSSTPLPEPSYGDNGFMNVSALAEEYRKAAGELAQQMPYGYSFPEELPSKTDPDVMSPAGSGEYEALVYWRCAWTAQFLTDFDAQDEVAIDQDLDVLETWLLFPAVVDEENFADQKVFWRDEVIKPAREGLIGNLRTFGLGPCKPAPTPDPAVQFSPTVS